MRKLIIAAVIACLSSVSALAAPLPLATGNDLYTPCSRAQRALAAENIHFNFEQALKTGECIGQIEAALFYAHEEGFACIPNTVTIGQILDVVMAYIKANPKVRDQTFTLIVSLVAHDTWPCQNTERVD